MKKMDKVKKILTEYDCTQISVHERDDIVFLEGEMDSWDKIVAIGKKVSKSRLYSHVVNNIHLKGFKQHISQP